MAKSIIIGTGSSTPAKVVTNDDLARTVETSDEWIRTRSGISERRIAVRETTSSLSTEAAQRALEAAGCQPSELDLIIVGTVTPDMPMPSTACLVQQNLGARKAGAFDVSAACSAFVYGLAVADKFIKDDPSLKVLVIGAEVMSSRVDWTDRTTCVLFGDGAGAAVLTGGRGRRGILSTHLRADGSLWPLLCIKGGGCLYPPGGEEKNPDGVNFVQMKGGEVFKHAVRSMEEVAREALAANNLTSADLDLFIPHQANIRIIEAIANRLGVPMEKVLVNIDRFGNTSAATIPIALDEAVRGGRIKKNDIVLLDAFGGGFTWGATLIRW
ncbi:MAG: beta-ketoacyl-ACP synthase III [Pseudomonadota bacterium]